MKARKPTEVALEEKKERNKQCTSTRSLVYHRPHCNGGHLTLLYYALEEKERKTPPQKKGKKTHTKINNKLAELIGLQRNPTHRNTPKKQHQISIIIIIVIIISPSRFNFIFVYFFLELGCFMLGAGQSGNGTDVPTWGVSSPPLPPLHSSRDVDSRGPHNMAGKDAAGPSPALPSQPQPQRLGSSRKGPQSRAAGGSSSPGDGDGDGNGDGDGGFAALFAASFPTSWQGGRYTTVRELGSGSFGVVYLCIDHGSTAEVGGSRPLLEQWQERYVALKVIDLQRLSSEEAALAMNEAAILRTIRHPHIVACYDTFYEPLKARESTAGGSAADVYTSTSGRVSHRVPRSAASSSPGSASLPGALCIVTEYCEGGDLGAVMRALEMDTSTPSRGAALEKEEEGVDAAAVGTGLSSSTPPGFPLWDGNAARLTSLLALHKETILEPPAAGGDGDGASEEVPRPASPPVESKRPEDEHPEGEGKTERKDARRRERKKKRKRGDSDGATWEAEDFGNTGQNGLEEDGKPRRRRHLECFRVMDVARQCLDGLCYLHSLGVMHRDIKPSNIYLARDESGGYSIAKLGDFGVSRLAGNVLAQLHVITEGEYNTDLLMEPHAFPPDQLAELQRTYGLSFLELERQLQQVFARMVRDILSPDPESRPSAEALLHMYYAMRPSVTVSATEAQSLSASMMRMSKEAGASLGLPSRQPTPSTGLLGPRLSSGAATPHGGSHPPSAAQPTAWDNPAIDQKRRELYNKRRKHRRRDHRHTGTTPPPPAPPAPSSARTSTAPGPPGSLPNSARVSPQEEGQGGEGEAQQGPKDSPRTDHNTSLSDSHLSSIVPLQVKLVRSTRKPGLPQLGTTEAPHQSHRRTAGGATCDKCDAKQAKAKREGTGVDRSGLQIGKRGGAVAEEGRRGTEGGKMHRRRRRTANTAEPTPGGEEAEEVHSKALEEESGRAGPRRRKARRQEGQHGGALALGVEGRGPSHTPSSGDTAGNDGTSTKNPRRVRKGPAGPAPQPGDRGPDAQPCLSPTTTGLVSAKEGRRDGRLEPPAPQQQRPAALVAKRRRKKKMGTQPPPVEPDRGIIPTTEPQPPASPIPEGAPSAGPEAVELSAAPGRSMSGHPSPSPSTAGPQESNLHRLVDEFISQVPWVLHAEAFSAMPLTQGHDQVLVVQPSDAAALMAEGMELGRGPSDSVQPPLVMGPQWISARHSQTSSPSLSHLIAVDPHPLLASPSLIDSIEASGAQDTQALAAARATRGLPPHPARAATRTPQTTSPELQRDDEQTDRSSRATDWLQMGIEPLLEPRPVTAGAVLAVLASPHRTSSSTVGAASAAGSGLGMAAQQRPASQQTQSQLQQQNQLPPVGMRRRSISTSSGPLRVAAPRVRVGPAAAAAAAAAVGGRSCSTPASMAAGGSEAVPHSNSISLHPAGRAVAAAPPPRAVLAEAPFSTSACSDEAAALSFLPVSSIPEQDVARAAQPGHLTPLLVFTPPAEGSKTNTEVEAEAEVEAEGPSPCSVLMRLRPHSSQRLLGEESTGWGGGGGQPSLPWGGGASRPASTRKQTSCELVVGSGRHLSGEGVSLCMRLAHTTPSASITDAPPQAHHHAPAPASSISNTQQIPTSGTRERKGSSSSGSDKLGQPPPHTDRDGARRRLSSSFTGLRGSPTSRAGENEAATAAAGFEGGSGTNSAVQRLTPTVLERAAGGSGLLFSSPRGAQLGMPAAALHMRATPSSSSTISVAGPAALYPSRSRVGPGGAALEAGVHTPDLVAFPPPVPAPAAPAPPRSHAECAAAIAEAVARTQAILAAAAALPEEPRREPSQPTTASLPSGAGSSANLLVQGDALHRAGSGDADPTGDAAPLPAQGRCPPDLSASALQAMLRKKMQRYHMRRQQQLQQAREAEQRAAEERGMLREELNKLYAKKYAEVVGDDDGDDDDDDDGDDDDDEDLVSPPSSYASGENSSYWSSSTSDIAMEVGPGTVEPEDDGSSLPPSSSYEGASFAGSSSSGTESDAPVMGEADVTQADARAGSSLPPPPHSPGLLGTQAPGPSGVSAIASGRSEAEALPSLSHSLPLLIATRRGEVASSEAEGAGEAPATASVSLLVDTDSATAGAEPASRRRRRRRRGKGKGLPEASARHPSAPVRCSKSDTDTSTRAQSDGDGDGGHRAGNMALAGAGGPQRSGAEAAGGGEAWPTPAELTAAGSTLQEALKTDSRSIPPTPSSPGTSARALHTHSATAGSSAQGGRDGTRGGATAAPAAAVQQSEAGGRLAEAAVEEAIVARMTARLHQPGRGPTIPAHLRGPVERPVRYDRLEGNLWESSSVDDDEIAEAEAGAGRRNAQKSSAGEEDGVGGGASSDLLGLLEAVRRVTAGGASRRGLPQRRPSETTEQVRLRWSACLDEGYEESSDEDSKSESDGDERRKRKGGGKGGVSGSRAGSFDVAGAKQPKTGARQRQKEALKTKKALRRQRLKTVAEREGLQKRQRQRESESEEKEDNSACDATSTSTDNSSSSSSSSSSSDTDAKNEVYTAVYDAKTRLRYFDYSIPVTLQVVHSLPEWVPSPQAAQQMPSSVRAASRTAAEQVEGSEALGALLGSVRGPIGLATPVAYPATLEELEMEEEDTVRPSPSLGLDSREEGGQQQQQEEEKGAEVAQAPQRPEGDSHTAHKSAAPSRAKTKRAAPDGSPGGPEEGLAIVGAGLAKPAPRPAQKKERMLPPPPSKRKAPPDPPPVKKVPQQRPERWALTQPSAPGLQLQLPLLRPRTRLSGVLWRARQAIQQQRDAHREEREAMALQEEEMEQTASEPGQPTSQRRALSSPQPAMPLWASFLRDVRDVQTSAPNPKLHPTHPSSESCRTPQQSLCGKLYYCDNETLGVVRLWDDADWADCMRAHRANPKECEPLRLFYLLDERQDGGTSIDEEDDEESLNNIYNKRLFLDEPYSNSSVAVHHLYLPSFSSLLSTLSLSLFSTQGTAKKTNQIHTEPYTGLGIKICAAWRLCLSLSEPKDNNSCNTLEQRPHWLLPLLLLFIIYYLISPASFVLTESAELRCVAPLPVSYIIFIFSFGSILRMSSPSAGASVVGATHSLAVALVQTQEQVRRGVAALLTQAAPAIPAVVQALASAWDESSRSTQLAIVAVGTIAVATGALSLRLIVSRLTGPAQRNGPRGGTKDDGTARPSPRGWLAWRWGVGRPNSGSNSASGSFGDDGEVIFADPTTAAFAARKRELDKRYLEPLQASLDEVRALASALEIHAKQEPAKRRLNTRTSGGEGADRGAGVGSPTRSMNSGLSTSALHDHQQRQKEGVLKLQQRLLLAGEQLTQYMVQIDDLPVGTQSELKRRRKDLIVQANGWAKELDKYHTAHAFDRSAVEPPLGKERRNGLRGQSRMKFSRCNQFVPAVVSCAPSCLMLSACPSLLSYPAPEANQPTTSDNEKDLGSGGRERSLQKYKASKQVVHSVWRALRDDNENTGRERGRKEMRRVNSISFEVFNSLHPCGYVRAEPASLLILD
eukprot:gene10023-7000_t